jgi:UDP-N-acetylglucosamine diphosphorylase/glucosamine-1-phosphate N-acetyltransferase
VVNSVVLMRNIIFFDGELHGALLPLTFTRPVADLRVGILTIKEKWERRLNGQGSFLTQPFLQSKFPLILEDDNYLISSGLLPSDELVTIIANLSNNEVLLKNGDLVAARLDRHAVDVLNGEDDPDHLQMLELPDSIEIRLIEKPWHLLTQNKAEIEIDFDLLTQGRSSQPIPLSNRVVDADRIFIEEGASVELATLNASTGSIYIGSNAVVMEGCLVRGPLALCDKAQLRMGTRIYGPTTIGPGAKAGGEINNSILWGNTNKAHEGYLGNAVLGEWCNLGADTNNSDLKNNYEEVKLWSHVSERFEKTGLQFLGLIMGDHSKCGINTMFNTGTVVGVSANIFGDGFPRNFIPSFSWGGAAGFQTYQLPKALDTINRVWARRNRSLEPVDLDILQQVYQDTAAQRVWEKANQKP